MHTSARVLLTVGLFFLGCLALVSEQQPIPQSRKAIGKLNLPTPKALQASTATPVPLKESLAPAPDGQRVKMAAEYGKLPLSFEANEGQADGKVKFLSRGHGYSLFLTGKEAVIALKKAAPQSAGLKGLPGRRSIELQQEKAAEGTVVRMELAGANAAPRVVGAEELPGKINYLIGNDPAKWRTNISTYAKVKSEGVYPGVDLVYYGNQGQLEYDFVVAPSMDPKAIRLKFRGAGELRVDRKGDLLLGSGIKEVRFEKPMVYQELAGKKKPVEGSYLLASADQIGFRLGDYDHSQPLVIDPVLSYSTYLGGDAAEGYAIAVDTAGDAYVTGNAGFTNFPTANGLQPALGGPNATNAFITKFNSHGSALVYSTYLGGSNLDTGYGIAVDTAGNAYVTGVTSSANFPTVNALQATLAGSENAFITKINASGSALIYSTYLGGSGYDAGMGIAVDASGNAYVAGNTGSIDFPTANALQPASGGGEDAFVAKINASGSALVYSTYLGGSALENGEAIAVDTAGNAYVTGQTSSTNFPTANALQSTSGGGYYNAFVTKINASGSALVYSTYLGGSGSDGGSGIAVDASGNVYVTGNTSSTNFPKVNALQSTLAGNYNGFVTKFNATGSALIYSTYLGGSGGDQGNGIAVDASGNAYVTGITSSFDFPTVNALQSAYAGTYDAFVSEINANGSALIYSTYLGGSNRDFGLGIAADPSGNAYVTGNTSSTNFPTANALQAALGGRGAGINAFVTKISPIVVGDFTGTFDTFNQRVAPGQSAVYDLTIIPLYGFTGNVMLAASNLPVGTAVSFAPQTVIGGSGTTAITVQTSTFTPQNSYDITLTATSGTLVHSTAITINVGAIGDFIGSFDHGTATVAPGGSATYTLTLTPLYGFTANVTLSASGLPAGATASFSPVTVVGGSGSSTLTVSTTNSTPTGLYPFTVVGTTPGLSHSTSINLLVGAPDFTGSINPTFQAVAPGGSAQYTLTLKTIGTQPFGSVVTPTVSGLPAGVTATFNPATINPDAGGSAVLTLATSASTPQGTVTPLVTAAGNGQSHGANVTLSVSTAATTGDFSGNFSPMAATASPSSPATYTLTLTSSGGFNGNVALGVSGLPYDTVASFSPSVVPGASGTSVLTVSVASTTPPGIYTINVNATSGSTLSHTTSLTLLVGVVDFTGTITPTSQTVAAGKDNSAQYLIQLSTLGTQPFGSIVTLYISGLPAGVTANFSSSTISPDVKGTSVLTLTTAASTPVGSYTPLLTATGGGVTHAASVGLTVQ